MGNRMDIYPLSGKDVWSWRDGEGAVRRAIIVMQGADFSETLPVVEKRLAELRDGGWMEAVVLVGFDPLDWNRDLTPWPAPGLRRGEDFAGQAGKTLKWMEQHLVPWVRARFDPEEMFVAGYSLGGLTALWSCYESDVFSGCASCSGSLWYDGWIEYMQAHRFSRPVRVYLSLGQAEERARNPRLARVGDATRRAGELLRADQNVTRTDLQWHPGGHFNGADERVADALMWMLRDE